MSGENRQFQRYPVAIAAEVELRGELVAAATQNVSAGGVGVVVPREVPEGATLPLTLFLTQDGIEDPDEAPFEVKAVVQWAAPQDEPGMWSAGLRFADITPAQRTQLDRFLTKLSRA